MGTSLLDRANVFGRFDGKLYCEGVPLEQLAADYGTPLYIYSSQSIVAGYRDLDRSFSAVDHLIAYSVKANGNLSILELLAAQGAGADIVSGGELYRALRAGIPADRIVFSGVGKTEAELAAALEAGIYGFNIESAEELRTLARLARSFGVEAPVALRINPDIQSPTPHEYTRTGHLASKFGIPSARALDLYREAVSLPGIHVRGIAAHIGSQIEEVEPYRLTLLQLLELVEVLRLEGIQLEYLDLGGGFGIPYGEAGGLAATELAEVIVPYLQSTGLRLVLEPGRYIVGPAGVLVTSVQVIKEMGGKTFVVMDAGMNDLLRPSYYDGYHRIEPVEQRSGRPTVQVDVVGPICETGDFLALDRAIELPQIGELLAIKTVGAYGFSMASQYNARPRPAEVLVTGDRSRIIRRRESYEDLIRGEIV